MLRESTRHQNVTPGTALHIKTLQHFLSSPDECWNNDILEIAPYGPELENGSLALTYPIWFNPSTFRRVTFPFFAGGLEVNETEHTVAGIKVVALNYFVRSDTEAEIRR